MPPKLRPIKKTIALTSNPPQHTFENDPNHRAFLERSMKKSDTEISALIKLNSSLEVMRDYIAGEFGMNVLLDIGEGFISLNKVNNDNDDDGNELVIKHSPAKELLSPRASTGVDAVENIAGGGTGNHEGDSVDGAEKGADSPADTNSNGGVDAVDLGDDVSKDTTGMGQVAGSDSLTGKGEKDDTSVSNKIDTATEITETDEKKGEDNNDNKTETGEENASKSESNTKENNPSDETKGTETKAKNLSKENEENKNTNISIRTHYNITDPAFQPIITNFLLRLKLRRKLLNRLSRRLLRLNHAMDGRIQKISPPMLPKYGTSFAKHATSTIKDKVTVWSEEHEARESVLKKIWDRKAEFQAQKVDLNVTGEEKEKNEGSVEVKKEKEVKREDTDAKGENKVKREDVEMKETAVSDCIGDVDAKESTEKIEEKEIQVAKKDDSEKVVETDKAVNSGPHSTPIENKNEANDNNMAPKVEQDNIHDTEEDVPKPDDALHTTDGDIDTTMEDVSAEKKDESELINQEKGGDRIDQNNTAEVTPKGSVSSEEKDEGMIPSDASMKEMKAEGMNGENTAGVSNKISPSMIFEIDPFLLNKEHQNDFKKLVQYDADYAKKISVHLPTSTVMKSKTALTREELDALDKDEDDFDDSVGVDGKKDMNHGIGAVSKFMTKKEKVMEWKRWQTEFLSKIPDQPTFQELGLNNRVFLLEERRQVEQNALKKESEGNNVEEEDPALQDTETEKNNEDMMDIDRSDSDEDSDNGKRKRDDESDSNKAKKNRKEKDHDATNMKQKRISLDPVPSFYQQDYSRILMIQSATLSAALSNSTREAYQHANTEYNQIFSRSQSLQSKKNQLENELVKLAYDFRVKVNNVKNSIAMAKVKWESEKEAFEAQKIQRMQMNMQMRGKAPSPRILEAMGMSDHRIVKRSLAGTVDRVIIKNAPKDHATGSQYTSATLLHTSHNSIRDQVATSLAHCIDVVVNRVESGWLSSAVIDEAKGGEQFPPFIPPGSTSPDHIVMNANGETYTMLQKRIKLEINKVKSQLDISENARSKAWSRLNKAKAALNNRGGSTSNRTSTEPHRKKASVATKKYTSQPATQRIHSPKQQVPVHQHAPRHHVPVQHHPTYKSPVTATNNPAVASAAAAAAEFKANMNVTTAAVSRIKNPNPVPSGNSENKYSLEKVRARIHSDGSVRPVSEPKRGKDGLFLRPAGRQRKGMDWDAINGRWVPADRR